MFFPKFCAISAGPIPPWGPSFQDLSGLSSAAKLTLCLADPSDGTTAAAEMESVAGRVEFGGCTSILPHNYILNAKNNSRFVKKMWYQFQWRYIINFVATTLIYRVDWSMVGKWPQTWVNWCQLLSPGSRPRRFGWFFTKPCFDLAWHSATAWGSGLEEKRVLGVFFGCC